MFEGFGRKIVAKVHEVIETGKAEESMTEEQAVLSRERENLFNELKNSGIEVGDDLIIEKVRRSEEHPQYMYVMRATLNGRRVQFWFNASESLPRLTMTDLRCAIDGEPVSSEEASVALEEAWRVITNAHWLRSNDMGPLHNIP